MKEHVYITGTGELVRELDGLVKVGLSPEAQAALGDLRHFQTLKIGEWVEEGDHLFVVEGTLAAAEFYAPVRGQVAFCAPHVGPISDWLVSIVQSPRKN